MTRLLPAVLLLLLASPLPAQFVPRRTGQWNPDSLGNHRAVVEVKDQGDVAWVNIPWRRPDPTPEAIDIIVIGPGGTRIANVYRHDINREFGELAFQPVDGPGTYYLYFMPYQGTLKSNYPRIEYAAPAGHADARMPGGPGARASGRQGVRASVTAIESIDAFNTFAPMQIIATRSETERLIKANPAAPFLVFPEAREYPIRMRTDLPERWIHSGPGGPVTGTAQPGEWFAFQVGVFASSRALDSVAATFTDLRGPTTIPASAITCVNLEGVDWQGRPFERRVAVDSGRVYPLWCGIQVPDDAKAGEYRGGVTVKAGGRAGGQAGGRIGAGAGRRTGIVPVPLVQRVPIILKVAGPVIEAHGDNEPSRLSRLRWLNSTLHHDDGLVAPYTPVTVRQDTLSVLGRDVVLAPSGFPSSIRSWFTPAMTGLGTTPKELLAAPVALLVQDAHGKDLAWAASPAAWTKKTEGAAAWTVTSTSGPLTLTTTAQLDFDGTIEYQVALSASRNVNLGDVRLELPMRSDAVRYFMGMNLKGGVRPESYDWKWDVTKNQDAAWLGDVNGGVQFTLTDDRYVRPLNTNFYQQKPLVMPASWENRGRGGCRFREEGATWRATCFSGARTMLAGEVQHFNLRLAITPFHPMDPPAHWRNRYFHAFVPLDSVAKMGANVINVHHATAINPFINYPFLQPDTMRAYIAAAHQRDMKVKIYYTVRELTNRAPELWTLLTLGDEVLARGPRGGWSWLQEHVEEDYLAGWFVPEITDAALVTSGVSRWHNFYIEGLDWLARNDGIDGLYLDDVAFDRTTMMRARKALQRNRPGSLIDLHSANQYNPRDGFASSANLYLEHFPFIDRLWFGEYFDYDSKPDYWLVELSGVPFGLMGEMLEGGGNPWRGMLFGMTNRLPWSGDPRPIWKEWDRFGIQEARMIGWWVPDAPVRTNREDVLVTTYAGTGKALLAVASWAPDTVSVPLRIDWRALGIDSSRATITAAAIDSFQAARTFRMGEEIPVAPKEGWLLEVRQGGA